MIYDFYEILGRGIIAARTGRYKEACKMLTLAAKIEPDNPRVWLWLATASETVTQKRQYLQEALKANPKLLAARVLLDHMDQIEITSGGQSSESVIFTCSSCGGKQRFDPDVLGLQCEYCGKVELLALENRSNAESSLDTSLQEGSGNWALLESRSNCGACGANISHPPNQATISCPFCNSDLITIQSATPDLVTPTAIAPFQYHRDDVLKNIGQEWKIALGELANLIDRREMTISSIYLPFWTFDGRVQILCALGYRVDPVTYSHDERVILKGEWPMEKSWFECEIDDLLVYAAHTLTEQAIASIAPFDLKSILEFRPEILTGWQAENYQVALEDAAIEAHKRMRDIAFKKAARRRLFMEPSRMLQNDVLVIDKTYKLILLPVWIIRLKMSGKVYRTFVNGQSGRVAQKIRLPKYFD